MTDYSKLFADHDASVAGTNSAATVGIAPQAAVDAHANAPVTGVPPSLGMLDAPSGNALAGQRRNANILQASSPLTSFVASDPAKAAAVGDDYKPLANVGAVSQNWAQTAAHDFFAPMAASSRALVTDAQRYYNGTAASPHLLDLIPGFNPKDRALGSVLADVANLAFSPLTGAANVAARPLSYIPTYEPGTLRRLSQPEAQAQTTGAIMTALSGLGAGGIRAPIVRPPPIDEGFFGRGQPQLSGPTTPIADAEFHDIAPPGVNPVHTDTYSAVSALDAEHVMRMQDAVADTATHGRAPDLMTDYLANHTAVGDQTVSVPPEAITKLWAAGHEVFADQQSAVHEALGTGEDVKVPLAQYLTETAGKPYAEELNAATRFREGGVSVEEAKGLPKPTEGENETVSAPREVTPPEDIEPEHHEGVRTLAANADSAIQQVFKETALDALFTDPKAVGMTPGQFERYAARVDEARTATHERLLERTYNQIRKERTPEFKASVELHSEAARNLINAQPNVRAYRALRDPLFKLDTQVVANLHPDLPLPAGLTKRDGLAPDEAAELTGHGSGAELVADLHHLHNAVEANGGTLDKYVANRARVYAEEQSRADLGYDVSKEGLLAAAREAMVEPEIEGLLTDDLRELAQSAGLPFDRETVKAHAEELFGKLTVAEATKPKAFAENMRRLGAKAEVALMDEKPVEAFRRKQQQLLQYLQMKQAFAFVKEVVKDAKLWNRVAKNPTLDAVTQDALNWSKDILSQVGVEVRGNPADLQYPISGYPDLRSFITAKNGVGADIVWAPIPRVTDPRAMTVEAHRGVAEMVRSIIKTGREELLVRRGEEKVELEAQVDAGIEQLARYTRTITHEEQTSPTVLQRIDRARRYADAWLVRLEQLMLDFGARDVNSPFFQVVSRRLEAAKGWNLDQRTALAKHFAEVNADVGKGFDGWMKAKLGDGSWKAVVTRDGDPIFNTNKDITVAAMHMGDAEALRKFAEGYGTDIATVEAAVHAHATDQMWKVVEGVWESFNKLRPEIERQFLARTDVHAELVEPREFTIPEGGKATPRTVKGGYFPVMYDPVKMPKEWLEAQDPNAMLGDTRYVRATPNNKYLKARTGVSAPVQMNLNQIYSRLNQVIHDLAYRDALIDINKFLTHPRMTDAIARKYGPEYVGKIRRNLERIARSESTDTNENRAVSKAVDWLTEGQMINMIGLSPTTVLKHGTTALGQPLAEVGPVRYAGALWDYMRDANSVGRKAEMESPEIRHIISAYGEDAYQQFLALTQKTGLAARYRRFAFHTIGFVNKQIAIATYNAAKEKLRDENPEADEGTIQAGANQIVRQALGSSGPTDAPDALSASRSVPGRFYRLQNQFLTFFSHMYNRSREIPQTLGYAGQKVDLSRAIALLITSIILPVTVDAVFGREVKKLGSWVGGLSVSLIHQTIAPVPGVNTAVGAGLHVATHGEYQSHDSAVADIGAMVGANVKDIEEALKTHEWKTRATKNALVTFGQITHTPGLEMSRLYGFFDAMVKGKEANRSLSEKVEDFIYGPKEESSSGRSGRRHHR